MPSKGYKQTEEHKKKLSEAQTGSKSCHWKGGRIKKKMRGDSYKWIILKPDHPRAIKKYVYEHILVAEEMLGRYLKFYGRNHPDNEVVHHINMDKNDNRPENLLIISRKEHTEVHKSATSLLFSIAKDVLEFDKDRMKYILKNKKRY